MILDIEPAEAAVLLSNGDNVLVILCLAMSHQYELSVHIYS